MPKNFFDSQKSIEAILYIAQQTTNLFNIIKTLYYADKLHLESYGSLITSDRYVAMDDGPVPSGAYELIKEVRGDAIVATGAHPETAFEIKKQNQVIPRRAPNLEYLSEADVECLQTAVAKYAKMDPKELWSLVREEEAYKRAKQGSKKSNPDMPLRDIIRQLPNSADIFEYLAS